MGNKGGKAEKGKSAPNSNSKNGGGGGGGGASLTTYKGKKVRQLLDDDDVSVKRGFKAALKPQGLDHAVDFLEACDKRINVFTSGQRSHCTLVPPLPFVAPRRPAHGLLPLREG